MNQEKLWLEFSSLPPHAQKMVLEFIAFVQKCYNQIQLESPQEKRDVQNEMKVWFEEVRKEHPFAKMSKEDVLIELRKTREEVYGELYGDRHTG
ncbi:hypothetical protein QUF58_12625 [Anaerolineales bacterium HSG24]|nr:hypothetical protein [Anaerolineales bacterium HSG24]